MAANVSGTSNCFDSINSVVWPPHNLDFRFGTLTVKPANDELRLRRRCTLASGPFTVLPHAPAVFSGEGLGSALGKLKHALLLCSAVIPPRLPVDPSLHGMSSFGRITNPKLRSNVFQKQYGYRLVMYSQYSQKKIEGQTRCTRSNSRLVFIRSFNTYRRDYIGLLSLAWTYNKEPSENSDVSWRTLHLSDPGLARQRERRREGTVSRVTGGATYAERVLATNLICHRTYRITDALTGIKLPMRSETTRCTNSLPRSAMIVILHRVTAGIPANTSEFWEYQFGFSGGMV